MPSATDQTPAPASDHEVVEVRGVSGRSAALQWGVLGLLIAVLLASSAYLVWHYTHHDDDPLGDERDAVMAASDRFMVTFYTYGPDMLSKDGKTMPSYRSKVGDLLTKKFDSEFLNSGVPLVEATVAQADIGRSAEVFATGVAALDDDTATALVTGEVKTTAPKAKDSKKRSVVDQQPFRVEVTLVKQHGEWLVDDYEPAEGKQSTGGTGMAQ